MDTSRRDQISRLYYEALERPAAERAGFIKEACKGDTSLQHELESLLRYATAAAGFLVTPAPAFVATAPEPIPERPNMIGRQVGPYKISALLGAGGMGEVYRARDSKLERDVAIKILPPHLTADPLAR